MTERTVNDELSRAIARRLGALRLVDRAVPFPAGKPDAVVGEFDVSVYPPVVREAFLEVRVYRNGDFTVVYHERRADEDWTCRWDRHENPHSSRDHFHEPPDAATDDAVDREYPDDAFDVLGMVLGRVDERIGAVWAEHDG